MKYFILLVFLSLGSCSQNTISAVKLSGIWGNENENTDLMINTEKAIFNFTCGIAEINQDISNENTAVFLREGTYIQQFGNIPEDYDPAKYTYTANFRFTQNQDLLIVEITKKTDGTHLGIYNYRKDEKVLVKKCP
ncbi:hypothetical protein [Lacihabitans soyangensis]|uniref:Uncharacterized protein n=1 Tax=Lacihabitans soyangensis TaxID=869394 RepID=A0AAE3KRH7_9BACT|nr:hypothetical protein [Lacihabitans soyangensis]MCP9762232.1 hypothetical protein [Lacihabitans soyangensis]